MPVITYREALNQALREEMQRDDRVFVIGEDIGVYEGAYKVTQGLLSEFGPKRVRDTPISEEVIVGAATGAALVGLRPVAEMMTINFALLAMDQIVNHAAKLRYMSGGQLSVPMVIRAASGGGQQLAAQHSQCLEVWFAHVPGLKVVSTSTPYDAKGLLKTSIRDDNPVIFFEHVSLYNTKGEVPDKEYTIPLGAADVKREGRDTTLVTYSHMTLACLQAAQELAERGVSAEVVDLRSLKPLDLETIVRSVQKTGRLVVVEEDWKMAGMGAEVAASVCEAAFDYLDAPILRVGGADVPMPYAKGLEKEAIPDKDDVIAAVHRILDGEA